MDFENPIQLYGSYLDRNEQIKQQVREKGFDRVLEGLENDFWLTTGKFLLLGKPEATKKEKERILGVQLDSFGLHKEIKKVEVSFENNSQLNPEILRDRYLSRVEVQRACITAKTQRMKNRRFKGGRVWQVDMFENLTTIKELYDREKPMTAGRDQGEQIQRFTKSSRNRMMNKARRMKKEGLPLPYFVTLTYQHNMKNFRVAKKQLNTFFQRFRRIHSDFRYFWKMEPQKRGAIHFHIAFFPPSGMFPDKYETDDQKAEFMRMRVSSAWNEVSEQSQGFDVVRSENGKYLGNMSLIAGTNVRPVENWKMFTGYVGKYMKKEVSENPWDSGKEFIKRREIVNFKGSKAVPVTKVNHVKYSNATEGNEWYNLPIDSMVFEKIDRKKGALNTGRWWGFSRNFDFKAIQSGALGLEDLNELNEVCNVLNTLNFTEVTKHLKANAVRAKDTLKGYKLEKRLIHLRNTYVKQKARFLINKEKIDLGYSLQFELNESVSSEVLKYLSLRKQYICPLELHYYEKFG